MDDGEVKIRVGYEPPPKDWRFYVELVGALLVVAILVVMVIDGRSDDPPPNPCAGQDADTGVSEECKDFLEWDADNPPRISLTLP